MSKRIETMEPVDVYERIGKAVVEWLDKKDHCVLDQVDAAGIAELVRAEMSKELRREMKIKRKLVGLAKSIAPQTHMSFKENPQLEALLNGWIDRAREVVTMTKGRFS